MGTEYNEWVKETGEEMGWPCVPLLTDSTSYDLSDCPDYGCSDCPATMNECEPCGYTEEDLRNVLSYKWR